MLERADHRKLTPAQSGFAQARYACISFDFDDQLIAVANPDWVGFDLGDAHDPPQVTS
jgi:hypothetical protein